MDTPRGAGNCTQVYDGRIYGHKMIRHKLKINNWTPGILECMKLCVWVLRCFGLIFVLGQRFNFSVQLVEVISTLYYVYIHIICVYGRCYICIWKLYMYMVAPSHFLVDLLKKKNLPPEWVQETPVQNSCQTFHLLLQ